MDFTLAVLEMKPRDLHLLASIHSATEPLPQPLNKNVNVIPWQSVNRRMIARMSAVGRSLWSPCEE